MGTHTDKPIGKVPVKTTIEIADPLLDQAKRIARRQGVTLKTLVERGLRHIVTESEKGEDVPFRLRKASFRGKGLRPELAHEPWEHIRAMIYEGRGD